MNVVLSKVELGQKPILRNLVEYYEYDFSIYTDRDVNSSGTFEYKYLDNYWTEENRYPYFIIVNEEYAGFALIRKIFKDEESYYSMAEFFVLKKYRRKNVGKKAAYIIFKTYKGTWHIHQHEKNIPSQKFWREIIKEFTKNNYKEVSKEESGVDGPCQIFHT